MNVIKRWHKPTPTKYKKWGKLSLDISKALTGGLATAAIAGLPALFLSIIGGILFITGTISGWCFAQVEEVQGDKDKTEEP